MKNRDYKNFAKDHFYHIFNRGNNKSTVFYDTNDFSFFLLLLKECLFPELIQTKNERRYKRKPLPEKSFSLIAFCLMPNHFHFIIKQNTLLPISKMLSKICISYSMYFNRKYKRLGQVFQDQFKSILIDSEAYLLWVSAYIHQNPKAANLVEDSTAYSWCSYSHYLGLEKNGLCDTSILFKTFGLNSTSYKIFVESTYQAIQYNKEVKHLLLDELEDAPLVS